MTDHRKQVDRALAMQTFRLLGGREYIEQMNPYNKDRTPVEFDRFERYYRQMTGE